MDYVDVKSDSMNNAIQEMMDRIKKGTGLKPVNLTERVCGLPHRYCIKFTYTKCMMHRADHCHYRLTASKR